MTVGYSLPVRVYYEDTDAGGVVYYANYLRFMERARTEWLRSLGIDVRRLAAERDVVFAVRSAQIDYRKPARLSDLLTVTVTLERLGRASLYVRQVVRRGPETVCTARIRLACLDQGSYKPRPLPQDLVVELV